MPLPTITDDDLQNVDVTKPLSIMSSPLAKEDPERAKLLMQKMGNPLEVQQVTTAEFRIAIEQRIKEDLDNNGKVSDSTLEWLVKMNDQLTKLHNNLYGSKSVQVSMTGKVTSAQIASLMRQSVREDLAADVVPKPVDGEVVDAEGDGIPSQANKNPDDAQ